MNKILLSVLLMSAHFTHAESMFPLLGGSCEEVMVSMNYEEPNPEDENASLPTIEFNGFEAKYAIFCNKGNFSSLTAIFVTETLLSSQALYDSLRFYLIDQYGDIDHQKTESYLAVHKWTSDQPDHVKDTIWGPHTNDLHLGLNFTGGKYSVAIMFSEK